tara:strand:- start:470 stop:1069 length:600 start_codon:yes stop_codon:yes gene_type:complete
MIKMKKVVTPGETPAEITISMIDQDLIDGVNKTEMSIKYGIKPWEVDEMFKHPFLKGRRPARKRTLSFSFVDDMSVDTSDPNLNNRVAKERADVFNESLRAASEALNPNQVTIEQAIDEAIDTVTEVKNQMQETQNAINNMLTPTEFEDKIVEIETFKENETEEDLEDLGDMPSFQDTLTLVEEQEEDTENKMNDTFEL